MKNFILLLIFGIYFTGNALPEPENYKRQAASVMQFNNQGHHNSIFTLYSWVIQTILSLDEIQAFFNQVQAQAGKIRQIQFESYKAPVA